MYEKDLDIIKRGSDPAVFGPVWGGCRAAHIQQLNGSRQRISHPADHMMINEDWGVSALLPNLAYMPEIDRVLVSYHTFTEKCIFYPAMSFSDDRGKTWSEPWIFRADGKEAPESGYALTGLTYLGGGKVLIYCEASVMENNRTDIFGSFDYGESWTRISETKNAPSGLFWWKWDPYFVDKDPVTGEISRLINIGFCMHSDMIGNGYCQPWIRYSYDEGRTWTEGDMIPQWRGWNENTVCRAANGDLLAAIRSDGDPDMRYDIDWNSGLGISVSKDNGVTWSIPSPIYKKGRMHPSFIVMPDGTIIMTYVCRKGYGTTEEGFWMYGIEALASYDNGETWDLDHRYILASWKGCIKGIFGWICGCQGTSTQLLPDGTLLTAYGILMRTQFGLNAKADTNPTDVGLVRWKLNKDGTGLNDEKDISRGPYDSQERNYLDPRPLIFNVPYICPGQPEEQRIFQRGKDDHAMVPVEGTYEGNIDSMEWRYGAVLTEITGSAETADNGFRPTEWLAFEGKAACGSFSGKVKIPAGGWYRLELRGIKAGKQVMWAAVKEFGVGEVFVIAGGSNAANSGSALLRQKSGNVKMLGWNGWSRAEDPMKIADGSGGSPWPEAGRLLSEKLGMPVGFASVAVFDCGVSKWLRWVYSDDRDLYYKLKKVLDYLGGDGCRAVLWHQGERDSADGVTQETYAGMLTCMISQIREDAGWEVPWVIGGASWTDKGDKAKQTAIRRAQKSVCGRNGISEGPDTDELTGAEWRNGEASIHFNEKGLAEHGRRWAEVISKMLDNS
jgi:hypothetical protein